jgi:hypothetical protein
VSGWACLHRTLDEHWIFNFDEPDKALAWVYLVMMANHKECDVLIKGRVVSCKRGQLARSQITLQKKFNWSQNKLKRFLKLLKNERMIDFETNDLTTVITICNYDKFQEKNKSTNEQTNDQTNDQTNEPRTTRRTTNNNDNNDNNVNNIKNIRANALVEPCKNIFDYWKSVMGHPQSQLLDKRKKLIQKTLSSGYTEIQVRLAIDGHKKSEWHNKNGFDGIEYSLKAENIDKFIKMAGMTDDEINRANGKLNWDDWSWADGLQAELGVRTKDYRELP